MITVRFPTGFSVQYDDLNYIGWVGDVGYLYKDFKSRGENGSGWRVKVPPETVIEFIHPCRIYNAAKEESDAALKQQIEQLRKEVRSLTRKMGKRGK